GSQGRDRERDRPPLREGRDHRRPRPRGGRAAAARAGAEGDLPPGRPHPRLRLRRQQEHQGLADRALADLHGDADQALRAGGARDVRGHRDDQGRSPRARRALEDRRRLARQRRRPRRRLRWHEGQPRTGGGAGAARRAHRHRALERGPGALRLLRALAGAGLEGDHRRRREVDGRDRPRRPALARDRPQGAERPPRRAAHGLEDRHQERVEDARARRLACRGALGRRGLRRGRRRAPAPAGRDLARGPRAPAPGDADRAAGDRRGRCARDQGARGGARRGAQAAGGGGGPARGGARRAGGGGGRRPGGGPRPPRRNRGRRARGAAGRGSGRSGTPMAIRAYKLAEELGIEKAEFVARATELGVVLKSAMASIEEDEAELLRRKLGRTSARDQLVTEQRVEAGSGAAVIRRRKKAAPPPPEPAAAAAPPPLAVEPERVEVAPERGPEPEPALPEPEPEVAAPAQPEPVPAPIAAEAKAPATAEGAAPAERPRRRGEGEGTGGV